MLSDTARLKLICAALRLKRRDVALAVTLGGIPVSASRADAWMRADNKARARTGELGGTQWRDREITGDEFDAFVVGLGPALEHIERDERQDTED